MNILHLATHTEVTRGGAVQMLRLARGLALRGHRVVAAFNCDPTAFQFDHPLVTCATAAGARVIAYTLDADPLRALWRAGVDGQPFDVLHVHREEALLAAASTLRGERIPAFIAQRGTVYLPAWFSAEHRLLRSHRIDRIIAVAHAVKQALVRKRFVPARKIEVVYGGVDTTVFHPDVSGTRMRLRHAVPQGTRVVTLPGALIDKKSPADFIHAAALVRKQRQGVRFWVVGRGKLEPVLRSLCDELDLGALVDFLGHVDSMPEIYAASDLVVCCAVKGEGLTGTLREALAMGRPVATTRVAGNPELVEDGVTGFVVRPADPQDLARAILRALNDFENTIKLAEAGRQRVLACCAEEHRSERVEQIYRDVLAAKGSH